MGIRDAPKPKSDHSKNIADASSIQGTKKNIKTNQASFERSRETDHTPLGLHGSLESQKLLEFLVSDIAGTWLLGVNLKKGLKPSQAKPGCVFEVPSGKSSSDPALRPLDAKDAVANLHNRCLGVDGGHHRNQLVKLLPCTHILTLTR